MKDCGALADDLTIREKSCSRSSLLPRSGGIAIEEFDDFIAQARVNHGRLGRSVKRIVGFRYKIKNTPLLSRLPDRVVFGFCH
jgi:hypothetical protein